MILGSRGGFKFQSKNKTWLLLFLETVYIAFNHYRGQNGHFGGLLLCYKLLVITINLSKSTWGFVVYAYFIYF